MIDLEIFTDKISHSGSRIMERAYEVALLHGHNHLKPEHLLKAIMELERSLFDKAMSELNVEPIVVVESLQSRMEGCSRYVEGRVEMSTALRTVLSNALKRAHEDGRRMIESEDLLAVLYKGKRSLVERLTRGEGLLRRVLKRIGQG